jgi:hypothetical protein
MASGRPQTISEVLFAFAHDAGLEHVPTLLDKLELHREALIEVADEFDSVGMRDLATLCRKAARRAKPRPRKRSIQEKYDAWTASGRIGPWPID